MEFFHLFCWYLGILTAVAVAGDYCNLVLAIGYQLLKILFFYALFNKNKIAYNRAQNVVYLMVVVFNVGMFHRYENLKSLFLEVISYVILT